MIGLVKKEKVNLAIRRKFSGRVDEKRKRERRAANRAKGRAERVKKLEAKLLSIGF